MKTIGASHAIRGKLVPMKARSQFREGLEHRHSLARELWDANKPIREIAAKLGVSVSAACGDISRLRKKHGWFPKRRKTQGQVRPPAKQLPSISLPPGTPVSASYLGRSFTAHVAQDRVGLIVDGVGPFKSFSAAAMGAVWSALRLERQINGLDFWKVTLRDGRVCSVNRLRERPELVDTVVDALDLSSVPPPPPRERGKRLGQVSQLLNAGHTVPEAAAALQITERAVHVSIYRLRKANSTHLSLRPARLRQLLKSRRTLTAKLGEVERRIQEHLCLCGQSYI